MQGIIKDITHLPVYAEVERPEVLARPGVSVAELPQPLPVQLEAALHHEGGEREAVAQLVAALVRRHRQPHVPEPGIMGLV